MSFIDKVNEIGYDYVLDRYKQIYGEEKFKIVFDMKKPLVLFIVKEKNPEKGFYKKLEEKELEAKNKRKDELLNMLTVTNFFFEDVEYPMYISTFYFAMFILTNNKPGKEPVEVTGLGPSSKKYLITDLKINRNINYIENVNVKDYIECEVLEKVGNKTIVLVDKPLPLLSMTHEHIGNILRKREVDGKGHLTRKEILENFNFLIQDLKRKIEPVVKVSKFEKLKNIIFNKDTESVVYFFLVNTLLSEIDDNEGLKSILSGYSKFDLKMLLDNFSVNRSEIPYLISDKVLEKWVEKLEKNEYHFNKYLDQYKGTKTFSASALIQFDKSKPFTDIITNITNKYLEDKIEIKNYLEKRNFNDNQITIYLKWLILFKTFYIFSTNKEIISIIKRGASFISSSEKINECFSIFNKLVYEIKGDNLEQELFKIITQLSKLDKQISSKGIINSYAFYQDKMTVDLIKNISSDLEKTETLNEEMKNFVVDMIVNI